MRRRWGRGWGWRPTRRSRAGRYTARGLAAYAAGVLGVPARIFVPEVSPAAKVNRIRGYGADLVVEGATYSDAFAVSQRWVAESGALPVHGGTVEEVLAKVVRGERAPARQVNRRVPRALQAVCEKAMALRPEARYGSAKEFNREMSGRS